MPLGSKYSDWDACKADGKSDEYCGWLKAHASPDAKEAKNDDLLFEGRIYLPTEKATKSSLEFNGKNYEYSKDATEAYYDYEKFKAIEKIYSAPKEQVLDYIKNNPGKSGEDIGKVLTGYDIMKAKDSDEIQMPLDKLEREGKIIYRENGWYIKESTESNSLQSPRGKEDPEINSLQTPMGDEAMSEEDLQLATNDEFPEHVKDEMAIKTEEGNLTTWADPNSEMNKKRHERNMEDEKIEFDGESYVISPRGYIAKENDLEFNGRVYVKEKVTGSTTVSNSELHKKAVDKAQSQFDNWNLERYQKLNPRKLTQAEQNDLHMYVYETLENQYGKEGNLKSYWGGWQDPEATKGKYKKMEPDEETNKEIKDKLDSISTEENPNHASDGKFTTGSNKQKNSFHKSDKQIEDVDKQLAKGFREKKGTYTDHDILRLQSVLQDASDKKDANYYRSTDFKPEHGEKARQEWGFDGGHKRYLIKVLGLKPETLTKQFYEFSDEDKIKMMEFIRLTDDDKKVNEIEFRGETYYKALPKHDTLDTDLIFENRVYTKVPQILDYNGESFYITDKKQGTEVDIELDGRIYSKEYDPVQVAAGTKIEMEHTKDEKKAEQIAKDHLDEVPNYYDKLIPAEKKWKNAKEEGSVSTVSGPPSDSTIPVRSKKVLVEPKKYIQSESIIIKTDKGYVGVPVFEAMGDNKCQFCGGAGEVIVEDLGLKECPRCEGNGQEPEGAQPINQDQQLNQTQQNPQIDQNQNPSITGSTVPQQPLQQQGSMNKNEPLDPTKTALPLGSDPKTGGQQPFNQPQQQLGHNPQQPPNNPNQSQPQHQLQQNPIAQHKDPNQHEQPQMNQQQEQPEKKEFPPKDGEDKKKEFPPKKKSGESEKRWIKGQDGQWHEIDESDRDYKFGQKEKGEETVCPNMIKYKDFIRGQIKILESKSKANESVGLLYDQNIKIVNESSRGLKVEGNLAYAGQSLNKRIYLGEELAKGDGMTVPLLLNHSSTAGAEAELHRLNDTMKEHLMKGKDYQVGEVTLKWHPEKLTLTYEGYITDPFFQKEITEANMAVSLGMYYDSSSPRYCGTMDCYTIIKGAEFREVSLVYHPGFPIATIQAVEAEIRKEIEAEKKKALEHIEPISTVSTFTSTGTLTNGTYSWTNGNGSTSNFSFN